MSFVRLTDYTWWLWLGIATALLAGLLVTPAWIWIAIGVAALQALGFMVKERSVTSFPAQLRIAYLLIVGVGVVPGLRPLLWVPVIGTYALCFFGYCPLARVLSLLPWNRTTPLTMREAVWTFLVAPDLGATDSARAASGCPGGVCTLDVQLARLKKPAVEPRAPAERGGL